jgi:hypothetical protein
MNERLKQLMQEAGYAAPELAGRAQKLAELIVRECSLIPDWCIETGKDQFVETCMAERTSKMIKQHFGVEE